MSIAIEALEMAIQMEKDGYDFFLKAAKKTRDPKGRDIFNQLARDEITHLKKLEASLNSIKETGQWIGSEEPVVKEYKFVEEPNIFTGEKAKQAKIRENADDMEVLKLAIELEADAVPFYRKKAEEIDDPKGKEVFNSIAQEEENHLTILQGEYDYVSNSGFWCGIQEFILEP